MQELFICEKCGKQFQSKKALGGHQGAHSSSRQLSIECETCKRVFNNQTSFNQHSCLSIVERRKKKKYQSNPDLSNGFNTLIDYYCQYCDRCCHNLNSLRQHEIRCKSNPDHINVINEQFNTKGKEPWNKGLTKEIDQRLLKVSNNMKHIIKNNPELMHGGLKQRSAKRCKYGTYKGFYCDSGWELAFLVYNLDHNILIKRNIDFFEYIYKNKTHKYYPDFIIDGIYYEIKGIYRDTDQAKIDQFPEINRLVIVDSHNIDVYVKYCEHKYGKDYAKILYDRSYPCWLDNVDKADKKYNFKLV